MFIIGTGVIWLSIVIQALPPPTSGFILPSQSLYRVNNGRTSAPSRPCSMSAMENANLHTNNTTAVQRNNDDNISDVKNINTIIPSKNTQNLKANTNPLEPKRKSKEERLGEYDAGEDLRGGTSVVVGDPQQKPQKEMSVSSILKELAAIQSQGPQKYCVLGTRHCSYLHQQIIELLAYALVLSGNHVYTSGAGGTHAATIRGAIRAERPDLLTVVLPQSLNKQPKESQELLKDVTDLVTMPQNDGLTLDVASRICNSYLLSQTDTLVCFAFHESRTVIEATKEARELDMLVTTLFLD